MNVLDLRGPDFLQLYLWLLLLAVVAALALRWWLRQPGSKEFSNRSAVQLHPFELAYLAGGEKAATDAAIAALVHRGTLAVDAKMRRLVASSLEPEGATALEHAVHAAVMTQEGKVAGVRRAVRDVARSVATRLEKLQFVTTPAQNATARIVPAMVLVALAMLGTAKTFVGVERGRPVGFLIPLVIVTLISSVLFALISPRLTRRGVTVLDQQKRSNAALKATAGSAPDSLTGNDLAIAFALFGASAFTFGPMATLKRTLAPPREGGSGCGSFHACGSGSGGSISSCGSGSSCGGGGGGCGGCGGGSS